MLSTRNFKYRLKILMDFSFQKYILTIILSFSKKINKV